MKSSSNSKKPAFKAFSIKEVIGIFSEIDEKIIQLHKCSSDDFLGLNADFKQYYHQSRIISENANEVFRSLTETGSGDLIRNLEDLYKELKVSQNSFSKHIESSISLLKELRDQLNMLFLPIKNLNQDLMTLKLLLANLKLSSSSSSFKDNHEIEKNLIQFNDIINEFKISSFQNETNLAGLKDQVNTTLLSFEGIRNRNIQDLDTILNHIHYGIILFAEKHEEASRLIPELSEKTKNSSRSIAAIITNLQYQDIIRQKMEHIQATHKKVLSELEEYTPEKGEDPGEYQDNIITRIRDIANLQSAQLVHANKEYQKAIEAITEKFLSIGTDMATIASMCKEFSASQENTEELHLKNLLEKIDSSASVLNSFLEAGNSFTSHIDLLTSGIENSRHNFLRFTESNNQLKQILSKVLGLFKSVEVTDEQLIGSLNQIEMHCLEIEKFKDVIQEVFTLVNSNSDLLSENIKQHLKTGKNKGVLADSAKSLNSISSSLAQKNERIQELLNQNLDTSKSISRDVRTSIEKIRYYDFFEKVIVEIIGELNQIYQKLKTDDQEEDSKEGLDSIKKLYTMASEHIIHDKITSAQGDVDLFDDSIPKTSEEDDNLELF